MIGSHRLRTIISCGYHPHLLTDLAAEVLVARRMQQALRDYLGRAKTAPLAHTEELVKCLESLDQTQNEQTG